MTPKERKGDETPAPLPRAVSVFVWVVTSASLTGILVGIGYVVYSAHAEFLGLFGQNLSTTDYLRVAGRFILVATLQHVRVAGDLWMAASTHWILATSLLVLVAALVLAVRYGGSRWSWLLTAWTRARNLRPPDAALAAGIVLFSIGKAAYLDLPAAQIRGVLLSTITCNKGWDLPPGLEGRARRLWRDIVCSRVGVRPGVASDCECRDKGFHLRRLRQGFVLAVSWGGLLVAATVILTLRAMRNPTNTVGGHRRWGFVIAMAALSLMNMLMVPYYYGKLLYPTEFNFGDVTVEGGRTAGYLLLVGEDDVAIFDDRMKAIVTVPRAQIKQIRATDVKDVVLGRIGPPPAPAVGR